MNDSTSGEPTSNDQGPRPPSKFPAQAASFIGGVPGTIIAMATALGGMLTAWQHYTESQATSRAGYDALKQASEQQATQIAALAQGQLELRSWVQELAGRLEKQQERVAKAVAKRQSSSAPAPIPPPPPPPAPPAPALQPAPTPAPLPAFDQLQQK